MQNEVIITVPPLPRRSRDYKRDNSALFSSSTFHTSKSERTLLLCVNFLLNIKAILFFNPVRKKMHSLS